MKKYIFIATEGSTYEPDSASPEPDTENIQVIGFGQKDTIQDALKTLLELNEHMLKSRFDEIIAFELKHGNRKYLSMGETAKKHWVAG